MFIFLLVFFIILKIYFPWFEVGKNLSNGDWPYLFLENIREFSFLPHQPVLWLTPYYQITAKIFTQYLGFPWELTEKIVWFWPFVLLSIFSSYYLTRSWIGVLIYTTNTYVLMLVGGGQMGVALAYSVAPLVLARFINLVNLLHFSTLDKLKVKSEKLKVTCLAGRRAVNNLKLLKKSIIAGLVLSLQVMWDPRVAYLTLIAVGGYALFKLKVKSPASNGGSPMRRQKLKVACLAGRRAVKSLKLFLTSLFFVFGVPLLIVAGLHMYWILPMIMGGAGIEGLGEVYTTAGAVKFLSFASFSNTISLLHPNWPENIFGKVYFMRGEFLILPILAFISLLFVSKKTDNKKQITKNRNVTFFSLLGLIGAFLAKGANPPFGGVYLWLFEHFPGFIMFRDPTKFYLLIVLSYSVLIPYFIEQTGVWLSRKITDNR